MITIPLPATAAQLQQANQVVEEGALLVVPTDTVYGIGANPRDQKAVDRLLRAKGRGRQMPPPVLVANLAQAQELSESWPQAAAILAREFWPGALTIVTQASAQVAFDLEEIGGTIALRQPSGLVLQVLEELGPLAVTSANLHGQPPALDCQQAKDYFAQEVSVYFDGGPCATSTPSTIVKLEQTGYQILREGAISSARIAQVLS